MEDETTEVAGTAQPAATGEGSSQGASDVSGFQQRIDELTAARHAAEREAAEARAGFQQSMERLARLEGMVQAGAQPQQREPELDLSEFGDAAGPLKKVLDAQAAAFQKQLAQMQTHFASQLQTSQVRAVAASMQLPPAVTEEAAKKMAVLVSRYGDRANADDALNLAIGEAIRNGTYVPQAAGPKGRAMGAGPAGATLHGGGGMAPPAAQAGGNGQPKGLMLPTNFEDMTPAQQAAVLQKTNQDIDFDL